LEKNNPKLKNNVKFENPQSRRRREIHITKVYSVTTELLALFIYNITHTHGESLKKKELFCVWVKVLCYKQYPRNDMGVKKEKAFVLEISVYRIGILYAFS